MRLEPLGSISPDQMDRLAIVAGVLSHVKENKTEDRERNLLRSFAVQMASPPQKEAREKRPA